MWTYNSEISDFQWIIDPLAHWDQFQNSYPDLSVLNGIGDWSIMSWPDWYGSITFFSKNRYLITGCCVVRSYPPVFETELNFSLGWQSGNVCRQMAHGPKSKKGKIIILVFECKSTIEWGIWQFVWEKVLATG